MGANAKKLTRRDLFRVGTAIAGAALLQPSMVHFAIGERQEVQHDLTKAPEVVTGFPQDLRPTKHKQPNVILIVLDTVRADHLSCYGYHRDTTPNIDAFAAGGRLYKNVLSPSCWTLPAHASLFTGLSCSAHGAKMLHRRLDPRFETLAEQLKANGYQTVGLSSNTILGGNLGFEQGFETYWTPVGDKNVVYDFTDSGSVATDMHGQLATWLTRKYDSQKPFFLFLNYVEAHQQYRPPRELLRFASDATWNDWKTRSQIDLSFDYMLTGADLLSSQEIAEMEALYDDEIRYSDRKVGEVLDFLKSTGLDENTVVMITSDHGDHFGEHHRLGHQYSLYEPLVRVPLIVRYADRFPVGEEEGLVQSHDVFPTILELAGIEQKRLPGQNSESLLKPPSAGRIGISEYMMFDGGPLDRVSLAFPQVDVSPFARRIRAIQRNGLKLIHPMPGKSELYDLVNDPMETQDLADEKPEAARDLSERLDAWVRSFDHYAAAPVSRERLRPHEVSDMEIKSMRGLGYL